MQEKAALLEMMRQEHIKYKNALKLDPLFLKNYEDNFLIKYTYESTAMEGNQMSLQETSDLLLNGKAPIKKSLREIYEQMNHKKAFAYAVSQIRKGTELDEFLILTIHKILTENIFTGGIYRQCSVYIPGAFHEFPKFEELPQKLKSFYELLREKNNRIGMPEQKESIFAFSCWIHAAFVGIHPFQDGNGRTSRMIMNYQLIKNNYLPISIPLSARLPYYKALDHYHCTGELEEFVSFMTDIELKELEHIIKNEKQIHSQKRAKTS